MEITEHELRHMYCDNGMTQQEIGELCGVHYTTIGHWIRGYGIKTRTSSESYLIKSPMPSKKELYDMYYVMWMSQSEIAKKIGVTQAAICKWMKVYGIETRTLSESKLGRPRQINPLKPSKESLENMYWVQKMSQPEIAKKIGVTKSTVKIWMKEYKIETRTLSESQLNGNFTGENANNWQGGISFEPYCNKFNNQFKKAVRVRDDYTCQLCEYEQKLNGKKLDVHHIHYDKKNCYPDVVALCRSCNAKVNGNRDYWEQFFENQLLERGLYCWSISQET